MLRISSCTLDEFSWSILFSFDNCFFPVVNANGLEVSVIVGQNYDQARNVTYFLKPVARSGYHWKLCWRASRDGWAAKKFHSLCDDKGPTVTIIKVGKYIFGGYASESWSKPFCCLVISEDVLGVIMLSSLGISKLWAITFWWEHNTYVQKCTQP